MTAATRYTPAGGFFVDVIDLVKTYVFGATPGKTIGMYNNVSSPI